jgi:hypothetical protein
MNKFYIFSAIILLLILLLFLWKSLPYAKYIVISNNNDKEDKYIAISSIIIYDERFFPVNIKYTIGYDNEIYGYIDTISPTKIQFNGSDKLYFDDKLSIKRIGPCIGAINSDKILTGKIVFVLTEPHYISKIFMNSISDDDIYNLQNINIKLLDETKKELNKFEKNIYKPLINHIIIYT